MLDQVDAPVPQLGWSACGDGLQCTTAMVPLDYDHPSGPTISLALVRRPASDAAGRIGSLFVNPGGPGESGVEAVRRQYGDTALAGMPEDWPFARVVERFDVVGLDPRGVSGSTQLRCFGSAEAQAEAISRVKPLPDGSREQSSNLRANTQIAQACEQRAGALAAHISTANVARDLDLLRQAVGDETLSYLGFSYGTYLGATYASLFPGRVRALALDSVISPVDYATGAGADRVLPVGVRTGEAAGADATLDEFFRLCTEGEASCAYAAGAGPAAKFEQTLQSLRRTPIQAPPPLDKLSPTLDDGVFLEFVRATLYTPEFWSELAEVMQMVYDAVVGTSDSTVQESGGAAGRQPTGTASDYANTDLGAASLCADTVNPRVAVAWPAFAEVGRSRAPVFGASRAWNSQLCAVWGVQDDDRYLGPWRTTTARPALVVASRFDPATPYESAGELHDLLPGSRLLAMEGWGHIASDHSTCAKTAIASYLVDMVMPSPGASCAPDSVPFAGAASEVRGSASRSTR
ncbi:MAG: alpha/beta hydrolase [Dermatophilaceae bacterium]